MVKLLSPRKKRAAKAAPDDAEGGVSPPPAVRVAEPPSLSQPLAEQSKAGAVAAPQSKAGAVAAPQSKAGAVAAPGPAAQQQQAQGPIASCLGQLRQSVKNCIAVLQACRIGGLAGLAKILAAQPGTWPLAVHLTPTETGIDVQESFGNVALPTATSEYYVDALAEGVTATITITHPGSGVIFCNVAAYTPDGNPVLLPDGSYDQLVPEPSGQRKTVSKQFTGPLQLVVRFYKNIRLRQEWASEQGWLPTIEVDGEALPETSLADRKAFSSRLTPQLEKAVVSIAPAERTKESETLAFVVNDGAGLYPNPQSKYSFFNPSIPEGKSGVKISMCWPSQEDKSKCRLLFGDLMVTDMQTTRTDASLPSDQHGDDGGGDYGTRWGEAVVAYIYTAHAPLSEEAVEALAAETAFLMRWSADTTAPGIVYRLVHKLGDSETQTAIHDLLSSDQIKIEYV